MNLFRLPSLLSSFLRCCLVAILFSGFAALPGRASGDVFADSLPVGDGWYMSPWFGYHHPAEAGSATWQFHNEHEWIYTAQVDGVDGIYMWSQRMGWWWSQPAVYPALYSFADQHWVHYAVGSYAPRWFFSIARGRWETIGSANGNVFVSFGRDTLALSRALDADGGILAIESGALAGVVVDLPPGLLDAARTISLAENSGTYTVATGVAGPILAVDLEELTSFETPMSITIPYPHQDREMRIPYYIDADGQLLPCQILSIDTEAETLTFATFHASLYTWVVARIDEILNFTDTGFRPDPHGFAIVNTGSVYNPGGECFGMTAFAQWHFRTKGTSFFPLFMEQIPTGGNSVRGQNIIATRTHTSIGQVWSTYLPQVQASQNLTPAQRLAAIKNVVVNTGNPTILYLYQGSTTGTHAVLCYAFNHNVLSIYDPNFPGGVRTISFNTDQLIWDTYTGYAQTALIGSGSFLYETFDSILSDAHSNFSGNGLAQITILSHEHGEDVNERTTQFFGQVDSGQVLVNRIEIIVNEVTHHFADVDEEEGIFFAALPLNAGLNNLTFKTYGNNLSGNRIEAPNTRMIPFALNHTSDAAAILMTLTWNLGESDLDLYVTDPTGETSWYAAKQTSDGGELDFDNTTGFGPEHWALTFSDTVRWGEPYTVRVHYYSDYLAWESDRTRTVTWNVNIKTNEDTPGATSTNHSGTLSTDNWENDGPGSSGPDWADVAIIIPVSPTEGALVLPPAPRTAGLTPAAIELPGAENARRKATARANR